jgi:hypothetical protein
MPLDRLGMVHGQIRRRAGGDLLHQRRPDLEAHDHLVPGGALEGGRDIAHPRHHAHAGQHGELGGAGWCRFNEPLERLSQE